MLGYDMKLTCFLSLKVHVDREDVRALRLQDCSDTLREAWILEPEFVIPVSGLVSK